MADNIAPEAMQASGEPVESTTPITPDQKTAADHPDRQKLITELQGEHDAREILEKLAAAAGIKDETSESAETGKYTSNSFMLDLIQNGIIIQTDSGAQLVPEKLKIYITEPTVKKKILSLDEDEKEFRRSLIPILHEIPNNDQLLIEAQQQLRNAQKYLVASGVVSEKQIAIGEKYIRSDNIWISDDRSHAHAEGDGETQAGLELGKTTIATIGRVYQKIAQEIGIELSDKAAYQIGLMTNVSHEFGHGIEYGIYDDGHDLQAKAQIILKQKYPDLPSKMIDFYGIEAIPVSVEHIALQGMIVESGILASEDCDKLLEQFKASKRQEALDALEMYRNAAASGVSLDSQDSLDSVNAELYKIMQYEGNPKAFELVSPAETFGYKIHPLDRSELKELLFTQ